MNDRKKLEAELEAEEKDKAEKLNKKKQKTNSKLKKVALTD